MYERRTEALLPRRLFFKRLGRSCAASLVIVALSLLIGSSGYHVFGQLPWIDALLNASMILTGMGPVDPMTSTRGKLFASFYALYSGIAFLSMAEVRRHIDAGASDLILLDVRDREAFRAGHLPGARNIPRGELELRADRELPDPTARIMAYCQFGKISTLAAHTLRTMGYLRTVALDGGFDAWVKADGDVASG